MKRFFAILLAVFLAATASAQNQILGNAIIQNTVRFTGDITPPALTADVNDYAPASFASNIVLRMSSDATRNITGLAGGTEGRWIWIWNVGSQAIVLKSESASSVAANRFALANDYNLAAGASVQIIYDATSSRWRAGGSADSGTVSSVSVTTANGVSGTVANATTTPAISLTLGAITPTSVAASGTVTGSNLSGTNTGDNAVNSSSQPLDADLTSIAGNATGGFLTRTAANTYTARTITGTAGQITVTNGDGVSGAPTISLPSTITQATTFSAYLTATGVGTIAGYFYGNGQTNGVTLGTSGVGQPFVQAYNSAFSTGQTLGLNTSAGGNVSIGNSATVTTFNSTVASTSTTSGAVTVAGGLGVAGAQFLGGNLTFGTSGSVLNGTTGSVGLTATGTNQSITLTPSGTGYIRGVSNVGGLLAGNSVGSDSRMVRIGNSRTQNYDDGLLSQNLTAVSGADTYQTLATGTYAGMEFYYFSGTEKGIRWITSSATQAAATPFTPTYSMYLRGSGALLLGTPTDSSNGKLQLATHTTSAGGIGFGTDSPLYRSAAGVLSMSGGAGSNILNIDNSTSTTRLTTSFGGSSLAIRVNAAGSDQFALTGSALTLGTSTPLVVNSTTASTSTTTGSLVNSGGFGNAGTSYLGDNIYLTAGKTLFMGTDTASTSYGQYTGGTLSFRWGNDGAGITRAFLTTDSNTSFGWGGISGLGGLRLGTSVGAYAGLSVHATGVLGLYAANANYATLDSAKFAVLPTTEATTGGAGSITTAGGIYAAKKIISATNIQSFGATAGIGYATGAGGAVTQITSRTTGVTLNTVSGAITLFTAAGSATATSFTVTNSAVAATDTIVLSVKSATNKYLCFVTAVAAGSFEITFYTTGGTASDAPVINYAVLKAVAS